MSAGHGRGGGGDTTRDLGATTSVAFNPALLTVTVVYGVLLTLARLAGLFGLMLGLLTLVSLCRYGYAVLRTAARGRSQFEAPGIESMNPVGELGTAIHFVLFFVLLAFFELLDRIVGNPALDVPGWIGMLVVAGVFPASAALMGIAGDIGAAVDPRRVAAVIGAMGYRYVKLLLLCVAAFAVSGLAQAVVPASWFVVPDLVANFFSVWVLVVVFALTGQAIYALRDEIEIPGLPETDEERRIRLLHERWQKSVDLAYASIRSGLVNEGYRELKGLTASEGESLEVHDWLFNRLLRWEDRSHALAVGGRLIELMLAHGEPYRAAKLYVTCRQVSDEFALPDAAAEQIEVYARSIGWNEVADRVAERRGRYGQGAW